MKAISAAVTKVKFKYETQPVQVRGASLFDTLVNEKIAKWLTGYNAALPWGAVRIH
jgi:hypothetical protein